MTSAPMFGSRSVLTRRVLVDEVYEAVLALVMDQVLAPGEKASIDGIARMLDVSPTPVREALVRLEAEGLVLREARKGYTVAPLLDELGLRSLYDMRQLLEPHAASCAAKQVTPQAREELSESVKNLRAVGQKPKASDDDFTDYRAFIEEDQRFHNAVAAHSGNPLLFNAIDRLRAHTHLYRLNFQNQFVVETVTEHEAILAAIDAGNSEEAAATMHTHIDHAFARMSQAMRTD